MMHLGSHLMNCVALFLSRQMQGNSRSSASESCVVCGNPASMVTTCCRTRLCATHLQAWRNDPSPCPCRR